MESQDELLDVFSEATSVTLREMAGVESFVRDCSRVNGNVGYADLSAILLLSSSERGFLVVSFPRPTMAALAGRILAESVDQIDEVMTRDCAGEVANVIAGQAKTLLVGSRYHFTFSTPLVVDGAPPEQQTDRLIATFGTELGDLTLHVRLV